MSFENNQDSVFTKKVSGGKKRTYYIDVKKTKGDDHFIILTESTKKLNGQGVERHKIFIYKEDLNRFLAAFTEAGDKVKSLMPEYDFDEFEKRYEDLPPRTGNEEITW